MARQDKPSRENRAAASSTSGAQPVSGGAPWGSQGVGLAQAAGETIPAPEPDKAGRRGRELRPPPCRVRPLL